MTSTLDAQEEDTGGDAFGGTSAFSFVNSEAAQPAESVFSFLNAAEAEPAAAAVAAAAPAVVTPAVVAPVQESSPMSGGSAFGFLSQSSEVDYSASLEQGTTRKKTRKALRPGHASHPQEAGEKAIPEESGIEEKVEEQVKPPPPAIPSLDELAEKLPEPLPEPQVNSPEEPRDVKAGYEPERVEPIQRVEPQAREAPRVEPEPTAPAPAPAPVTPAQEAPREVKKPPPPPPTPEEQLQRAFNVSGVWQWMDNQLVACQKEQGKVLLEEAQCLSTSQRMAEDVAALRKDLENTEAEQNSLCEKEQYEEADALDVRIQSLKDQIASQLEQVASGAEKLVLFADRLLGLTRDQAALSSKALERVEALQTEGDEVFRETEERSQRRVSAEEARMDSERKRMGLAQSHLQKDSENLQEEWQQVNEAIDQQTVEDVAERDQALERRGGLDEEIKELERQLAVKQEQRNELTQVIDSCDIRIACIRSKFEKQLGRLEGKQKRLEEAQKEMDLDIQQVAQMETELEKEREALRDQELQHHRQMKDIRSTNKKLRKQRWFLAEVISHRVCWQKLMEPHRELLGEARRAWERATERLAALSQRSAVQEAEAAKLRSQIDGHQQILPSLEAEKKLAVSSRSFKEAGRLTEEIRRREEGKKGLEAELEALQAALADAREELATCRQSEQEAEAELLKVEESCALEELRVLRHQVADLQELCQSCSVNDRRLYEQEVAVLQKQQEHLSKKYKVDLETLEPISKDVISDLQGQNALEPPSESEEEAEQVPNGSSEAGHLAPAATAEPAETPEPTEVATEVAQPEASVEAVAEEGLSAEAAAERLLELEPLIEELKAKVESLVPEIDEAVEVENFDLAEELETARMGLTSKLEALEKEMESLKLKDEANGAAEAQ